MPYDYLSCTNHPLRHSPSVAIMRIVLSCSLTDILEIAAEKSLLANELRRQEISDSCSCGFIQTAGFRSVFLTVSLVA